VCGDCDRLGLPCDWRRHNLSPQQRRRGLGSLRSRNDRRPRDILPNAPPFLTHGVGIGNEDAPAMHGDPPISGTFQMDFGSNTNSDWWPEMFQYPILLFDLNQTVDELTAPENYFLNFNDFSSSTSPSNIANSRGEPPQNPTSMPTLEMSLLDLASTIHPLPGLLAQFNAHPESKDLSPPEDYALHYYQYTLSLSHTTKDPTWSTSVVFLRLGSKRPLVMHLLLAATLKSLVSNQEVNNLSDMLAIAKHPFQTGVKLLIEELSNQVNQPSKPGPCERNDCILVFVPL
jgi:hypothetical protein